MNQEASSAKTYTELPDLPKALITRSPLGWLTLFGPGAVIASVTIGTGELIFSTRGGVLFGYNILFLFLFRYLVYWLWVLSHYVYLARWQLYLL